MVFFLVGVGVGWGSVFCCCHIIHVIQIKLSWLPKKKDQLNIIVKDVLQDIAFNIFDMFLILLFLL